LSTLTVLSTLTGVEKAFGDTKHDTDDHITINIDTKVDDSKDVKIDSDVDGDMVKTKIEIPVKRADTTAQDTEAESAQDNLDTLVEGASSARDRLADLPEDEKDDPSEVEGIVEEECPECTEVAGIPGEPPPG
jgi:hypothetical protein